MTDKQSIVSLILSGEIVEALCQIESLLRKRPNDIALLRLKGNTIEYKCFSQAVDYDHDKAYPPSEMKKARICYEKIILQQPNDILALTDLGSHWQHMGDINKASEYFSRAIALLSEVQISDANREGFEESLKGQIEILQEQGEEASAKELEEKLEMLLASNK